MVFRDEACDPASPLSASFRGSFAFFRWETPRVSEQHESWLAIIQGLREGQPEAAERLWKAFSPKLEDYAKRKFGGLPRRAYDEEDVALSAMMDFTEGIRNHRFPDLSSEESLARILFVIADRKVLKRIRHQTASKRGGGDVRGESVFFTIDGDGGGMGRVASAANEANGGEALGQECLELLDRLGDDELRTIAILRLQGYTTGEIAEDLEVSTRTVDRRLDDIRKIWSSEVE